MGLIASLEAWPRLANLPVLLEPAVPRDQLLLIDNRVGMYPALVLVHPLDQYMLTMPHDPAGRVAAVVADLLEVALQRLDRLEAAL